MLFNLIAFLRFTENVQQCFWQTPHGLACKIKGGDP